MSRLLACIVAVSLGFLICVPARAVPSWCQSIGEYDYWLRERMTQRGPLSSLSPSQRAYYKGVDKKMKRAYQEALRRIYADQSSVALQLARDIGFLNTFDPNLPQSVRYKYIEASERKDRAIVQSCGFNSLF